MSQTGDQTARSLIVRVGGAYSYLCCIAAGITGQADGSEDIVQRAFAIAIEKDLCFESEGQFVCWLAGVVRRCALNDRRKSGKQKTTATDPIHLASVEGGIVSVEDSHQAALELTPTQSDFDDQVLYALKQLVPEARACLLLRTVEQLSYKEISELMEIPEGTAMSMVHRSRQKLRSILAPSISLADTAKGMDDND